MQEAEGTSVHCYADIPDAGQGAKLMQLLCSMSWPVLLPVNVVLVLTLPLLLVLYVLQEAGYIPCAHLLL